MTHDMRPPTSDVASDVASANRSGPSPMGAPPRGRLMVIFNPTAGGARGRRLRRTLDALRARGCVLDLRETARKGDAEAFAAAARSADVDAVVVAGGDGTVNEALNGLAQAARELERAGSGDSVPPLGLIPLGTANVLALEIGQSLAPEAVASALVHGPRRACALARVTAPDATEPEMADGGRLFLLMGGAGFDAHVVENVKLGLKKHTGKLAYVWETLAQALRYPFPTVRGAIDGAPFEAATAVVLNGRLYGGPFVAAAAGDLTRRDLRLVLLHRKGLGNVLRYAVGLGRGRLAEMPDVTLLPGTAIDLLEPVGAPLQADGDTFCHLPVRVTVSSRTLDLIVPA